MRVCVMKIKSSETFCKPESYGKRWYSFTHWQWDGQYVDMHTLHRAELLRKGCWGSSLLIQPLLNRKERYPSISADTVSLPISLILTQFTYKISPEELEDITEISENPFYWYEKQGGKQRDLRSQHRKKPYPYWQTCPYWDTVVHRALKSNPWFINPS